MNELNLNFIASGREFYVKSCYILRRYEIYDYILCVMSMNTSSNLESVVEKAQTTGKGENPF